MRKLSLIGLCLMTVFLGCARNEEVATTTEMGTAGELADTADVEGDVAVAPRDTLMQNWEATVTPEGGTTVRGEGVARALPDGGTFTSLAIEGAQANARHPWHVHAGDCGSNGPIVGDPAAYPVLNVDADGAASAEATLDVALDVDGDYYFNIHESPENLATIVGCGEVDLDRR